MVEIDLAKGVESETVTFEYLGNIALGLANVCVAATPPHLGGLAEIGADNNLHVIVVGYRGPYGGNLTDS